MKYFLSLILLLSSCAAGTYQLFETTYEKDLKVDEGRVVYENEDAKVSYNFWNEGGRMSFRFYNKTKTPIYINVQQCYFIRNGLALSYYQAETTIREASSVMVLQPYTSGVGQTYKEQSTKMPEVIAVPQESYVIVGTKKIVPFSYADCGLKKDPDNDGSSLTFTEENTPLSFRNYVTYSFSPEFTSPETIDNKFWVSKISNIKEQLFENTVDGKDCEGNYKALYVRKDEKPNNFYVYIYYSP